MLKEEFLETLKQLSIPVLQIEKYWLEIEKSYSAKGRYYHNLSHLQQLLKELKPIQSQFKQWDVILFAILYHDFVYNVIKNNNEEESARYATKKLKEFNYPHDLTLLCSNLILATKKHEPGDSEQNLFTDADLSMLGASPADYKIYKENIRKEYSVYPDLLYNPGRKKVLMHFLSMHRIYKSDYFFQRYESTARINLETELSELK